MKLKKKKIARRAAAWNSPAEFGTTVKKRILKKVEGVKLIS